MLSGKNLIKSYRANLKSHVLMVTLFSTLGGFFIGLIQFMKFNFYYDQMKLELLYGNSENLKSDLVIYQFQFCLVMIPIIILFIIILRNFLNVFIQAYTTEFTILYQLGTNKKELIRSAFVQILIDLSISYAFSILIGLFLFDLLVIIGYDYPFSQIHYFYQYIFTFSFRFSDILIFGVINFFLLTIFCVIRMRMLIKNFVFSYNFSISFTTKSEKNQNWRLIYTSLILVTLLVLVIRKILFKRNPEQNSWNESILGMGFIIFLLSFSISFFFIGPNSYSFFIEHILNKVENKNGRRRETEDDKKWRRKERKDVFKDWWNTHWQRNDSLKRFSFSDANFKKILTVLSIVICLLSFSSSLSYSQKEYLERKSTYLQADGHVITLYSDNRIPLDNFSNIFPELGESRELFRFDNFSWRIPLPTFTFEDPLCDTTIHQQSVINFREWDSEGILDDEWLENLTWNEILPKLDDPEYVLCPSYLKTCGYQENQQIEILVLQNETEVFKNLTIAGFYHILPLIEIDRQPINTDQNFIQYYGSELVYGQLDVSMNYSIYRCDLIFHGVSHNVLDFDQNISQLIESQFPSYDFTFKYSETSNRYWNYWIGYNSIELEYRFLQYFKATSYLTVVICIYLIFRFIKQHLLLNETTNISYQLMGVSISELKEIERINAGIMIIFALPWWIIGQILTFFVLETYNIANSPLMTEFSRMYKFNPLSIVLAIGIILLFYLGYIIQTAIMFKKITKKGIFQNGLGKIPT